jgi:hypothetical protein
MQTYPWRAFLAEWSRALLQWDHVRDVASSEALQSGWLGRPGASEAQLAAAEARLGTHLPPSYRQFLALSNGWGQLTDFIFNLWSTEEIEWLRVRNQHLITVWTEHIPPGTLTVTDAEYFVYGAGQDCVTVRGEYLRTALEISDWGDSAICLLNPQVVTPEGEWEAWFFANWLPGANRYRSFWELMQAEYTGFLELRETL